MPVPCPNCGTEIPGDIPTAGELTYVCPKCNGKFGGDAIRDLRVAANPDDAYEAPKQEQSDYNAQSMPAPFPGPLMDSDGDGIDEHERPAPPAKKATAKKSVAKK